MNEIAKNDYYQLRYDPDKNWIYWTMKGYWDSMDVVPDFEKDWKIAMETVKKPFRIFGDLSQLKVLPRDVQEANNQMQKKLLENGCEKVSCLMESSLTKMSLNQVVKQSGMDKIIQYFDDSSEASKWLAST